MTIPGEAEQLADLRRAMGERLRADGFHDEKLKAHLRVLEVPIPSPARLPLWLARTAGETPLDSWIRLFILGQPIARSSISRMLGRSGVDDWVKAGLLAVTAGEVTARVYLQCYEGLLVAASFPPESGVECGSDHVLRVTPSTTHLANFAIPPAGGRLLDLGTGSGALALLASRTAATVIGVDLNAAAVRLAELNGALNGVENVEFRQGDCYAPVAGETFDRIIANPPFVISPETQFVYRDGGASGDEFCARLIRQAFEYLNEGGYCQLMCNWAHVAGEDWRQRVSSWLPGGCDALVFRAETKPVDEYAVAWLGVHPDDSAQEYGARFQAWLDYYREHAIEAISLGAIAFRRVVGSPGRVRWVEGPVRLKGLGGAHVRNGIDALPLLDLSDEHLLAQPLTLDPAVRVRRLSHPAPGGWGTRMAWVEQLEGLLHQEVLPEELASVLARCDGTRALHEFGAVVTRPESLGSVRRLLERGFFQKLTVTL